MHTQYYIFKVLTQVQCLWSSINIYGMSAACYPNGRKKWSILSIYLYIYVFLFSTLYSCVYIYIFQIIIAHVFSCHFLSKRDLTSSTQVLIKYSKHGLELVNLMTISLVTIVDALQSLVDARQGIQETKCFVTLQFLDFSPGLQESGVELRYTLEFTKLLKTNGIPN